MNPEPNAKSSAESKFSELDRAKLDLFLSEKEHIDKQINTYLDSNFKTFGFIFTTVVAGLGLLFSSGVRLESYQLALVLLALVALSCIGLLLGTVFNGFAFGYLAYKALVLGPLFKRHLRLATNPLNVASFLSASPARRPIVIGTILLGVSQAFVNIVLFFAAIYLLFTGQKPLLWLVVPAIAFLLVSAVIGVWLVITTMNSIKTSIDENTS